MSQPSLPELSADSVLLGRTESDLVYYYVEKVSIDEKGFEILKAILSE